MELSLRLSGFTGFPQFSRLVREIGKRSQHSHTHTLSLSFSLPAVILNSMLFNCMPVLALADMTNPGMCINAEDQSNPA